MDANRKLEAQIALHAAGFSVVEINEIFSYMRKSRTPNPEVVARTERMASMYRDGKTLEEVSIEFGVTRKRVRQILNKAGIDARSGGIAVRAKRHQEEARKSHGRYKDDKAMQLYGCTWDEAIAMNGGLPCSRAGSLIYVYTHNKQNARTRLIPWNMTLAEYKSLWDASGKWEQRGRGKGKYCIARKGDVGAYELGNVEIMTNAKNGADARSNHPTQPRQKTYVARKSMRDELGYTPAVRKARDIVYSNPRIMASELKDLIGVKYSVAYGYMQIMRKLEPELFATATKGSVPVTSWVTDRRE